MTHNFFESSCYADSRYSKVIRKHEFFSFLISSENELKEIFDYIDVDADGFISLSDLQMVLNELMPKLNQNDVVEMFAIVKKSNKVGVDLTLFLTTIPSLFFEVRNNYWTPC